MLTEQEKAQIRTKIRKEQYCITLDQMKQYFKDHQHAREIDDKKTMDSNGSGNLHGCSAFSIYTRFACVSSNGRFYKIWCNWGLFS